MKKRARHPLILPGILCLFLAAIAAGQMQERSDSSPARWFPAGALVYAEAGDLHALLDRWRDSGIRTDWQKSQNFAQFQSSRLYLKLKDRIANSSGGTSSFTSINCLWLRGLPLQFTTSGIEGDCSSGTFTNAGRSKQLWITVRDSCIRNQETMNTT
jgi:hypothetical protein